MLKSSLKIPIVRRIIRDITNVADLVGKLDLLRSVRKVRSVFDLQTLALCLRQRFVVGELADVICDDRTKLLFDLIEAHSAIFDRVVQQSRDDHVAVVNLANVHEKIGYLDRVVDVRLAVATFSFLIFVLAGGEACGVEDLTKCAHGKCKVERRQDAGVLLLDHFDRQRLLAGDEELGRGDR